MLESPAAAPGTGESGESRRRFEDSVNAVSLGFVATAILIAMFLVMAIFERFLRPRSNDSSNQRLDFDHAVLTVHCKLDCPSPKMTVSATDVSVLMPGEQVPTFIAHPIPPCCPPSSTSVSHQNPA